MRRKLRNVCVILHSFPKDIAMFTFVKNRINWVDNYMKIINKAKASAVLQLLLKKYVSVFNKIQDMYTIGG